ncbi:MAG: hypothetical protein ACD_77C00063G0009 [uncultured bacterium]|nr:MAG: hypothetical protein ACD_77C00063G0009 [uncultured bacterium]HBY01356.1 flavin reductase [Rikenellaceae bacterium]
MEMTGYKKIDPKFIDENLIKLISDDWMLVTAGNEEKFNTMTANWAGVGYLWNRPVAFVFIRPERYTYEFVEKQEYFSLTFFNEKYRNALNICGTKSGRDCNKVAEASLTPCFTKKGTPSFEEARLVIECKKLYAGMLSEASFLNRHIFDTVYGQKGNIHKLYIVEMTDVWLKLQ